jgi:hypothetical protein
VADADLSFKGASRSTGKVKDKFGLAKYFWPYFLNDSLHATKPEDMGPPALLTSEEIRAADFYRP